VINLSEDKILNKNIEIETFILINEINNLNLIDKLKNKIKEKVKVSKISRKTNVKAEHSEFNAFNDDPDFHEFLNIIRPSIQKIYKDSFVIRDVWGNVYSKTGDYCESHKHANGGFCGILYCTDGPGPGTYFKEYDLKVEEKKGRFVLFSPLLFHEVKPYHYTSERIILAWNFSALRGWEDVSKAKIIKK